MSNDNARPPKAIQDRFTNALSELIGICLDAGMHPAEMVAPLKREVEWCERAGEAPT